MSPLISLFKFLHELSLSQAQMRALANIFHVMYRSPCVPQIQNKDKSVLFYVM